MASVDQMAGWVADPDVVYTTVPMKVMDFAAFMHKVGRLKRVPNSWKDMFFDGKPRRRRKLTLNPNTRRIRQPPDVPTGSSDTSAATPAC